MIPDYYKCGRCGADGVKLFRKSATSEPVLEQPLLCGDCTITEQGRPLNLAESDQCYGRCPAVPDLRGGWWQYTSVPAEGCAWWDALPLRMTGEWPVHGGVLRWMPYRRATDLTVRAPVGGADLRRVDFHREGGAVALVFLPTADVERLAAALATVTAERERCAAIADGIAKGAHNALVDAVIPTGVAYLKGLRDGAEKCAKGIREPAAPQGGG